MGETKRCPRCGGLNSLNAEWCGQCFQRFTPDRSGLEPSSKQSVAAGVPVPPTGPLRGDAIAGVPAPPGAGGVARAATSRPNRGLGSTHGAFAVREQGVVWRCSRCDTENPLDQRACSVCGTTFAQVVSPKEERPERDPGMAALLSLCFPGAGHGYLGLWGQAVARGVLSLWVGSVVLVSLLQRGAGTSPTVGVLFAVAATCLWIVSAHDAYREARHEAGSVLLKGRVFLYLVLGLLVMLLVLVAASAMRAGG